MAELNAHDEISAEQLQAAFTGPIRGSGVSFFYQVGLLLVTLLMILLPLIYVSMIVAAGYGVYLYATHFTGLLHGSGSLRLVLFRMLMYFGPIFIGMVLVFFMIKPLFARRARHAQPLALNPEVEPVLYNFIHQICRLVRAPLPSRIDLDCHLNASAHFRRGLLSFFGNDLILTLGLPLVAGLNLRELSGVVAHEFGHFTQGFGMRLSYIVRRINNWFGRVVYQRDAWDVMLEEWNAEAENFFSMMLIGMTRLCVWLTRALLWLLMMLGETISCFLLRQMEYHADSYAIQVAGSAGFESTAYRLRLLEAALRRSYQEMRRTFQTAGRLPESFPLFLLEHEMNLPAKLKQDILDHMGLVRTRAFDAHPADADRIRQARREAEPGVFHLESPATGLFSNFPVVAKQVTTLHYTDDLGLIRERS